MGPASELLAQSEARGIKQEDTYMALSGGREVGDSEYGGKKVPELGRRQRGYIRKLWQASSRGENSMDRRTSHDLTFLVHRDNFSND